MRSGSPVIKKIMEQYGMTLESVSALANCSMVATYKALDLHHFSRCPLITIARIRHEIEKELSRLGWNGQREKLWSEFDATLQQLLQSNVRTPSRRARS